jgi:hypothetical protein
MKQITINTLTGSEPYVISLCDSAYNGCIYIDFIYNIDVPYTFNVPINFSNLSQVSVKAIDSNGCEIKDIVNL